MFRDDLERGQDQEELIHGGILCGGRGTQLEAPASYTAQIKHARNEQGRRNSYVTVYTGPVFNCSGKELLAA